MTDVQRQVQDAIDELDVAERPAGGNRSAAA